MPKIPISITAIDDPSRKFTKQVESLSKRTQKQLESAIDELLTGELPSGRHFEKFTGFEDVYTVRLNRKERFAFRHNSDDTIKPLAAGSHDVV